MSTNMTWTVTYFTDLGSGKRALLGTNEFPFKRLAVAAFNKKGVARDVHKQGRDYTVRVVN